MSRFVDVDGMVLGFLGAVVAPVEVFVEVPANRPARFVRAWRNGGASSSRVLDNPTVTVEAWAPDSVEAAVLAEDCRTALLNDYTAMPLVRGVDEVTGLYSVRDPDSETPRYRFSVRLRVRAAR